MFGEALDHHALRTASEAADEADLMLVRGSSLAVAPANGLPHATARNGHHVAVVNHDPILTAIPMSWYNDRGIGEVLQEVDACIVRATAGDG